MRTSSIDHLNALAARERIEGTFAQVEAALARTYDEAQHEVARTRLEVANHAEQALR